MFKESVLEIANLFIDGFKLDKNTESLKNLLDKRLENQYASKEINEDHIIGAWIRLQTKLVFKKDGKGFFRKFKDKRT